jgi:hypothetical protein
MGSVKIKGTKVYCWDPRLQRYVLMGSKIGEMFFKKVKACHFMRVVNGYGLQYDAFQEFAANGITHINVKEETGNLWQTVLKDWTLNGKIADYGNGKQIFLSLKHMRLLNREKEEAKKAEIENKRQTIIEERGLF